MVEIKARNQLDLHSKYFVVSTKHERDLARPGVYLPAAVRMGATQSIRGGSIFLFWDRAKVWHDPGLLV